jgi:Flp pilus assembly protein TadG
MTKTRRNLRQQRGAVAVEFALIMPVLLLILVGTLEFGRVWSQLQVFQGAAREGARCAAVQATDFSTCVIQDRINASAGAYTPATNATVMVNGVLAPAGCTDATREQDVRVYWVQPLTIDIPFWNKVTINATVAGVFRCE